MNSNRNPFYTLFFLLSVMAVLLLISLIFPEKGILLVDGIKLKFPSAKSLLSNDKPEYASIPEVVAKADTTSLNVLTEKEINSNINTIGKIETDTIASEKKLFKPFKKDDTEPVKQDELKSQRIEFANNNPAVLYNFFKGLENSRATGKALRIVHYGDSQIEGDRISGFIRERLQSRFGGGGPGLVPAFKIYNQASVTHENSGDWFRYTIFGKVNKAVNHKRYGAMCAFSKFTAVEKDSLFLTDTIVASASYNTQSSIYPSAKKFQRVKIYYGSSENAIELNVFKDNELHSSYILSEKNNLNIKTIDFDNAENNISLVFKGTKSPDIYGVSLEMPYGVSVDNIAMRGGSGTVFNKMDKGILSEMLKDLETELIMMQFGGNVLPYIKDEKACKDYGSWFYSQLVTLKAAKPGVSIIVIGPADMSIKKENYFETYPYLEEVRDALKEAAFKAGAGFWDMYKAMGGRNSMPSWVAANPPLASTDYVHFSPRGARIIAELFYEALNYEYENYRFKNVEASKE